MKVRRAGDGSAQSHSTNQRKYFDKMMKILEYLLFLPYWLIILLGIFLLLVVGWLDYMIITDVSLAIFYLLPIFLVTWSLGRTIGLIFSFFSTVAWFIAELHAQQSGYIIIVEWNAFVRFIVFALISYLLAEVKHLYEREQHLRRTDELTKIWNRGYFLELLDLEAKRFQRNNQSFTLAYIDVDNFKIVNDNWGHSRGDKLLILIAKVLSRNVRQIDHIARLGGDEFALLLPETEWEQADLVLKRVQTQLLQAIHCQSYPIGFSIGAQTFCRLPQPIDEMLEKVDQLMYQVKREGKNKINHQIYK